MAHTGLLKKHRIIIREYYNVIYRDREKEPGGARRTMC